jgi:D-3-phosphoglycerate dehydrogenase
MKILISTSSFAEYDKKPLAMLKDKGFEVVLNPYGRKLSENELVELSKGCAAIIAGTESYTEDTFSRLGQLRAIVRCGAGLDSIDLEAARRHSVFVDNTPEAVTQAVAELTLCFALCLIRKVAFMDRGIRTGKWKKEMGNLLSGKTVGLIGLGRIGRRVAELLQPFGVHLIAVEPRPDEKWIKKHDIKLLPLDELLKSSDIVSLHVPYVKENRNLINSERLGLMKPSALLINSSRGGLVDEAALYEALRSGRLKGAALDVMENEPYDGPLKDLDNVVLTPHIGSYAVEARSEMELEAVKKILNVMK